MADVVLYGFIGLAIVAGVGQTLTIAWIALREAEVFETFKTRWNKGSPWAKTKAVIACAGTILLFVAVIAIAFGVMEYRR
jgi:hypothetical protein